MPVLTKDQIKESLAKEYNELKSLAKIAGQAKDKDTYDKLAEQANGIIKAAESLGISDIALYNKARALSA